MSLSSELAAPQPASRFTLWHGVILSLGLHASILSTPFLLRLWPEPAEEDAAPLLVLDLNGFVSDDQADEKLVQQKKGAAQAEVADTAKANPVQTSAAPQLAPQSNAMPQAAQEASKPQKAMTASPEETMAEEGSLPPPQPEQAASPDKAAARPMPQQAVSAAAEAPKQNTGSAGAANLTGAEERQNARTIKQAEEAERDQLRDYIRALSKKVRGRLVYPEAARRAGLHGAATVAFTILASGQIRPESLRIIKSSGQPALDAGALATIRASLPLPPPPRELPIAIDVSFDHHR